MIEHFENIQFLYGEKASVRLPNELFTQLSQSIRNSKNNKCVKQTSFAYAYLVATTFLYKYAQYVDLDSGTYVQNNNLKELLGYGKDSKTINRVISKDGILERLGLVETTRDFPVRFYVDPTEEVDSSPAWEFVMMSELDETDILYDKYKKTVKNRNYEIREPLFLTTGYSDGDHGTLYSREQTHEITIAEFLIFLSDETFSNIDFLMCAFFKARCQGHPHQRAKIAMETILHELGIDSGTFYRHLTLLKERSYIAVDHGKWSHPNRKNAVPMACNKYQWKGI